MTKNPTITIKKYPNRRLYRTDQSKYITLEDLTTLVKSGQDFNVTDAKTGEDITRAVLVQIIFEQESKGTANILPINFLRNVISFYDDSLKTVLPTYLEASMEAFTSNQEKMREVVKHNIDELFPVQKLEEMREANMAMFKSTMDMLTSLNPVASYWNKDKKK